jgi:hypothetical protein
LVLGPEATTDNVFPLGCGHDIHPKSRSPGLLTHRTGRPENPSPGTKLSPTLTSAHNRPSTGGTQITRRLWHTPRVWESCSPEP